MLEPSGISQYAVATTIGVPARCICEIVKGERPITEDIAVRLGGYFDVDPQSRMNLQTHYDMERAQEKIGEAFLRKTENGAQK